MPEERQTNQGGYHEVDLQMKTHCSCIEVLLSSAKNHGTYQGGAVWREERVVRSSQTGDP